MPDTIEVDLLAHVLSHEEITAVVEERVHYGFFPPEEVDLPAILIECLGGGAGFQPEIDGGSTFLGTRFDIRCVGETFKQAIDLSKIVETQLDGFTGELNGEGSTNATLLRSDRGDRPVPLNDGSGQFLPARSIIFDVSLNC